MNKFKGLAGLVTGAVMLGISVLPSQSYAKPERIYTQQFGQKNRYDNIATGTNGDIAVYLSPLNQGDISVCDFKKREKRILKKTPDIYEGSPTLSPNGKKVAFFGTRNKKIMLYTSDLKGNYSEVMYVDGLTLGYPIWSSDNELVIYKREKPPYFNLYKINIHSKEIEMIGKSTGFTTMGYSDSLIKLNRDKSKRWCLGDKGFLVLIN